MFTLPISADDLESGNPPGGISPYGVVGSCELDDSDAPRISFAVASRTSVIGEGTSVMLTVNVTPFSSLGDIVVELVSAGIGANGADGSDYSLPNLLIIPQGASSASFIVDTVDDATVEADESFIIGFGEILSNNAIVSTGAGSRATISIVDND